MAGRAVIVAGLGFRSGASERSLADALGAAQAATGARADALATAQAKAASPALGALARATGLPVIAVAPDALRRQDTATRSAASRATHGTGSVAEAAALAAAGSGARLLAPRAVSGDRLATCALAQAPETTEGAA